MSHDPTHHKLEHTITTRWRHHLVGALPEQKRHWRTKVSYYEAVQELLRKGGTGDTLSWRTVVDAVRPRGHRSTFYEVAGPNAKHPLIGALLADASIEAMQLALCYRRNGAVGQLIDEAKVWSFWPHRDSLLAQLKIMPGLDSTTAASQLVSSIVTWTRQVPELARELAFAPPLCAVEDLLLLRCGQLSARYATNLLSDAMRQANPGPAGPDQSLAAMDAPPPAEPGSEALLAGLAAQIEAIGRESQRYTPPEATALRRRAADLLLGAAMSLI